MAPKGTKGKAIDRSTSWSDFQWDERGYWISSRLGVSGEREYDYRYPEGAQTPQAQQNTPRSPGPNVLNTSEIYQAPITSTTDASYGAYSLENNASYTTSSDPVSGYGKSPEYNVDPNSNTSGTLQARSEYVSSDTESEATVRNATSTSNLPYGTNLSYSTVPQVYQSTTVSEDVTRALVDMTIAGPSTQAYATTPNQGRKHIPNTQSGENYGKLDPRYKVIEDRNQKKFWKVGRVFMVLWTEPARRSPHDVEGGLSTSGSQSSQFSPTYLEGTAFSEIRRFVVVGEGYGNSICSPIHTYGGQATLKPNLPEASQHAIIYTSDLAPTENWYETQDGVVVQENLTKDPIKVNPEQKGPEGDLGTRSRINYSKVYTVENYVRVLNIGMVATKSMGSLVRNAFVKQRDTPIERPRNNPKRTSSQTDDNKGKGKGKEKEKQGRSEKRRH